MPPLAYGSHGLMISMPQPAKPPTSRVATPAAWERAMADAASARLGARP